MVRKARVRPLRGPVVAPVKGCADIGDMPVGPSFTLRAERRDDPARVATLLAAVDTAASELSSRTYLRQAALNAAAAVFRRPKFASIVAESDGAIVGYGALRHGPTALMLVNVLVSPEYQGNGIGRAIVAALCRPVVSSGQHVHLEVLLDSRAAHGLYRSLGFEEFGISTERTSGQMIRLMCLSPSGPDGVSRTTTAPRDCLR